MPFQDIAGQERVKAQVAGWLRDGRLPHAILVTGRRGTGKRRLALELARAANCAEAGTDACGRCPSCVKAAALSHPDLHLLLPLSGGGRRDGAAEAGRLREATVEYLQQQGTVARTSANISREHLRLLQREMSYAPSESRWRIALVFEADCMHRAGANSLLKILEEPPQHALFILISSAPDRLLPTVLSRCQRLHLRPLSGGQITEQLAATGVPPERAAMAGRAIAVSLLPPEEIAAPEFDAERQVAEAFLGAGFTGDAAGIWNLFDELGQRPERERLESFLAICQLYLRDLFMLANGRPGEMTLGDRRTDLEQWLAGVVPRRLEEAAVGLDRAYEHLAGNASPQLILADLWRQVNRCRVQASVPRS